MYINVGPSKAAIAVHQLIATLPSYYWNDHLKTENDLKDNLSCCNKRTVIALLQFSTDSYVKGNCNVLLCLMCRHYFLSERLIFFPTIYWEVFLLWHNWWEESSYMWYTVNERVAILSIKIEVAIPRVCNVLHPHFLLITLTTLPWSMNWMFRKVNILAKSPLQHIIVTKRS